MGRKSANYEIDFKTIMDKSSEWLRYNYHKLSENNKIRVWEKCVDKVKASKVDVGINLQDLINNVESAKDRAGKEFGRVDSPGMVN